jgi:YrbI family 3-deoxy-D-manno-octulosonate 8-phosphate phosphatase
MQSHAPLDPLSPLVRAQLARVQLLIFDFDGVWTTNQVLVLQDGTEGVLANRSDGLGVGMLRESGLDMLVLSAEVNPVVSARCNKVKVPCVQGEKDKAAALLRVLREKAISPDAVAYVGNDVNDIPCMNLVAWPIAVADSWPTVLPHAKLITTRLGGHGAVREVCEWFLAARAHQPAADGRQT